MCFCFFSMRFRTAFHEGTLDHGTMDDYFFLIISLLGRTVITLEQKVWFQKNVFGFRMHGARHLREMSMAWREYRRKRWMIGFVIPSAYFFCQS